ncbi:unnamed protein product [Caenorhabditis bovis]|uniref:G-protein coupled receptors family 1 profile domain-containing protein n=1 Tax=Caenorhabditis bovis TaxID=2654633 RepID=A0A8S1FAR5_9PELO|nr:unnamed protein product [Caenorhabditis bovis]
MLITDETYKIHRVIIYSIFAVVQTLGIFGNVNLIALTIRKKTLRSKYGMLLMILAVFHTICLVYEFVCMAYGIRLTFFDYKLFRRLCFYTLFPYIFVHCLQTGAVCALALDLLLNITFPIQYRTINTSSYFAFLLFPSIIYGIWAVIAGFVYSDNNEAIQMCNPPSSLHPVINAKWYLIMLIFSLATVIFYTLAFTLLYAKVRNDRNAYRLIEKKAMKTLQVLIFVFLITRLISISFFNILTFLGIDKDWIVLWQNYVGIATVIAYYQNGYVCYFRSSEYRNLFRSQLKIVFPKCTKRLDWPEQSVTIINYNVKSAMTIQ